MQRQDGPCGPYRYNGIVFIGHIPEVVCGRWGSPRSSPGNAVRGSQHRTGIANSTEVIRCSQESALEIADTHEIGAGCPFPYVAPIKLVVVIGSIVVTFHVLPSAEVAIIPSIPTP